MGLAVVFLHAWPESSGTAAEDCRCEGCIRHRLTLAHQDRPKPHARQGQVAAQRGFVFYGQVSWDNSMLPEGVGLLWASHREKGQRRIKKMYVEATASKQKPDCLGMRKDTRYT